MLKYIFQRLLIFIPTLIIISLLAFVISINSPSDPVEQLARSASSEGASNSESSASEKTKNEIRERLGLNLPVFYFSVLSFADSDTLNRISSRAERDNLNKLTKQFGNWKTIENYYQSIKSNSTTISSISKDSSLNYTKESIDQLYFINLSLLEIHDVKVMNSKIEEIQKISAELGHTQLLKSAKQLEKTHAELLQNEQKWKNYIPKISFSGFNNQYHVWLMGDLFTGKDLGRKGLVRGDFGKSYADNQSVSAKILGKFFYSFVLVFISIIIAYLVSIPMGIYAAYKEGEAFDNISSIISFMLYSIPSFFVGTWLLYYFSNPDNFMWFPTGGVLDPAIFDKSWSFMEKLKHQAPYFVLPIITYTYSSFAFISRIMKVSMLDVLNQDYIRTARAKGLSEFTVVTKHALKNSLLPIITMFANIFPAAVGGSVILETIFSIPGLGLEIYTAVISTDIPMIVAIFTITGVLTVLGYLVSDVLYAFIDPRIKYGK